jgi:hypothetical protein
MANLARVDIYLQLCNFKCLKIIAKLNPKQFLTSLRLLIAHSGLHSIFGLNFIPDCEIWFSNQCTSVAPRPGRPFREQSMINMLLPVQSNLLGIRAMCEPLNLAVSDVSRIANWTCGYGRICDRGQIYSRR